MDDPSSPLPRDIPRRFVLVAGEASGDLLGAGLIVALREHFPDAQFAGIGGERMIAAGFEGWHPMRKLSVMGLVEVLRHLPELLAIRRDVVQRALAFAPDAFIGIDAPDFNLGVERRLKQRGIHTVHYVSPSVWAWREERAAKIGRSADRVLCLFPMEPPIYARHGVDARFVGHPLADAMPLDPGQQEARSQLRVAGGAVPIAILPGSRASELELHADLVIRSVQRLCAMRPGLRFFVPLATRETRDYFERRLYALEAAELPITILFGHARLALQAAEVALVASGTATLEAALARCPMVVTYRGKPLTHWLV
jgi:lipid-A-disaccharide synthase